MLSVAVAMLALGQAQYKSPLRNDAKTVWVGGQREVLLGPVRRQPTVLGFYHMRVLSKGNQPTEIRVGHVTYACRPSTLDEQSVMVMETDGRRLQYLGQERTWNAFNPEEMRDVAADTRAGRACWIGKDGKIIKQEAFEYTDEGLFQSEAIFNADDSVSLITISPKGERKLVLHPKGGNQQFHTEFKPMVKDLVPVLKEKEYTVLDARGGMVKYKARYAGKFSGYILDHFYEGHVLETESGGKTVRSYITYAGELLKIEFPDKSAAMVELVPDKKDYEDQAKVRPATLTRVKVKGG